MTLYEIKKAVDEGKTVCWRQSNYVVEKWKSGYEIVCTNNNHAIGLQRRDNVEPTHDLTEFYIKGGEKAYKNSKYKEIDFKEEDYED